MRLARLAVSVALAIGAADRADPERCREALSNYNDLVAAIHAATPITSSASKRASGATNVAASL
jgi:hypothetical protein